MKLSPKGCRGRKRKIEKIEREKRWDKEEGSKRGREKEGHGINHMLGGCLAGTPPPKTFSIPRNAAERKKK